MALQRTTLTYRDYEALPDDGRRHQVLDGVLDVTPAPSPQHQDVLASLNDLVRHDVNARGLGQTYFAPIDVILADTTIVQPDLVYLATDRSQLLSDRGIEGPPTLVVEEPRYHRTRRAHGEAPMALSPFADLVFVPDSLWPSRV